MSLINYQKIQDGSVLNRLSGVRDELAHGREDDASWPLVVIAAVVGVLVLGLVLRRFVRHLKWRKVVMAPSTGLQLVPEDLGRWWHASDDDSRLDPEALLNSPSRFASHLSDLHGKGHVALVRRLHTAWLQTARGRVASTVMEILTGDRVVVRDEAGTLLAEGLARTASSSEVEMLVYDEGAGWPEDDDRVYLEKGNGFLANAKLRRKKNDAQWVITVGVEAELGHRREHYRVQARSAVLVFQGSRMLRGIRDYVLGRGRENHPLLEQQRRQNPPRYSTEFERRSLWSLAASARLEDLSVGGARVRVVGTPDEKTMSGEYFLFVAFAVDHKNIELLLPVVPLSEWEPCDDDPTSFRARFRFEGLARPEETELRTLLLRLATAAENPTSSVQNTLDAAAPGAAPAVPVLNSAS